MIATAQPLAGVMWTTCCSSRLSMAISCEQRQHGNGEHLVRLCDVVVFEIKRKIIHLQQLLLRMKIGLRLRHSV